MTAFSQNRFCELVGCRLPIQQAGMGGVSTPALAAAVAAAGALGMIGATGLAAGEVAGAVARTPPVGANFLVPFLDLGVFEAAASAAPLVECFYGEPDARLVGRAHAAGGALMAWQVGSVDEALQAADAGCDLIVVQGVEAGGHVRGATSLLPLVDAVRDQVDVPIVAAGGIGSGPAAAAAMGAGADAVRIGTVLLATAEANVHPAYLDRLVAATAADTVLTEAFSLGWPAAPHRVLRSCVEASDADPATRSPLPPTRDFVGDVEATALYAGTSVDDVRGEEPAAAVVARLAHEARGGDVIRTIVGFHQDEVGDWVAHLDCLHRQHVRHAPPFRDRPWVTTEVGRTTHLGTELDCPLCDRAELPDGLAVARTAGPFDETTLPAGLQRAHRVAASTWGRLRVLAGAVGFTMATTPPIDRRLTAGDEQAIPPQVPHAVEVVGPMRLAVDFLVE